MKKKVGIWIITFFLLFALIPSVYADEEGLENTPPIFGDLENHWVKDAAEALYNMGALPFKDESNFFPETPITRAELLYIILTVKGISPTEKRQLTYKDLPENAWYTPYVETAYQIGLIDGKGERFYPTSPLSRQNMIDIVVRSLGEGQMAENYSNLKALSKFTDQSSIDAPFRPILAYAADKGYISGDADNKINPLRNATRAESVLMIYHTLYNRLSLPDLQKEEVAGIPILYFQKLKVQATAYSSEEKGIGLRTALGWDVREGIVSVDPSVIPYGTHLYIPGYGFAVAADRGGEVRELKIDIYMHSLSDALKFGLKKNLTIYVLDPVKIVPPKK